MLVLPRRDVFQRLIHPWLQACSIILIYLYLYISIHALSILTNHYDDTSRKQNKITIFLAPKVNDRWFKNILIQELYILAGSNPTWGGVSRLVLSLQRLEIPSNNSYNPPYTVQGQTPVYKLIRHIALCTCAAMRPLMEAQVQQ